MCVCACSKVPYIDHRLDLKFRAPLRIKEFDDLDEDDQQQLLKKTELEAIPNECVVASPTSERKAPKL